MSLVWQDANNEATTGNKYRLNVLKEHRHVATTVCANSSIWLTWLNV